MRRAAVALALTAAACGGKSARPAGSAEPVRAPAHRVPIEDSEPEDGVVITSAHGHMEPEVVEAGIGPHKEALGACYTSRVGKRRWLGGHVSLHWAVKRDGAVIAVKLVESDLGAWPIEKCLLDVARGATFGKPVGGDAEFAIPLDFSATGRIEMGDEDKAQKAIAPQLPKLEACQKAKGVKGPAPEDVTITIYVGPQGKVQSAGFASPRSALDEAWADCAESAALAWRLPDPRSAVEKVAIRYRARTR